MVVLNTIYGLFAGEMGREPEFVHVPSAVIAAYDKEIGDSLLGDKSHSMIFDNSKIKRVVPDFTATIPFSQGAEEIMAWFDADRSRQVIDKTLDCQMDEIIAAYESAWPQSGH